MIKINVNNGQVLEVEQPKENGNIYVTKKDSQGRQQENTFSITAGDFVTMLNWYRYQKDIGNASLYFKGGC